MDINLIKGEFGLEVISDVVNHQEKIKKSIEKYGHFAEHNYLHYAYNETKLDKNVFFDFGNDKLALVQFYKKNNVWSLFETSMFREFKVGFARKSGNWGQIWGGTNVTKWADFPLKNSGRNWGHFRQFPQRRRCDRRKAWSATPWLIICRRSAA